MELNVGGLSNKNWISIKKVGLPELEEVDKYVHKSQKVLIQTKYGDMFVAHCEKRFYYGGKSYEIKWFSYGTGGRKMKVMSKVIAWMDLPDRYEGE